MTRVQPITNESVRSESEKPREQHLAQTPIKHIPIDRHRHIFISEDIQHK